jgi:hypothetical protein
MLVVVVIHKLTHRLTDLTVPIYKIVGSLVTFYCVLQVAGCRAVTVTVAVESMEGLFLTSGPMASSQHHPLGEILIALVSLS